MFKACGWNKCGKKRHKGDVIPKQEYDIWIPSKNSLFGMVWKSEDTRECFAGVFGLDIIFDQDSQEEIDVF